MLTRHNTELKQIYRFYAAHRCPGHEAFVMTLSQFWQFVRDTRLATPRMPLAEIDRLVMRGSAALKDWPYVPRPLPSVVAVQAVVAGAATISGEAEPSDAHEGERPLLLREFLQGLVALAAAAYPAPTGPTSAPVLPQKLGRLLLEAVLPRACQTAADEPAEPAGSGAELPSPALRSRLRLVHSYYATTATRPRFRRPKGEPTFTVRELLLVLQDTKALPAGCRLVELLVAVLPEGYTQELAAAEGEEEREDRLAEVCETELIFSEFEEAMLAFARLAASSPAPWDPTAAVDAEAEAGADAGAGADAPAQEATPAAEGGEEIEGTDADAAEGDAIPTARGPAEVLADSLLPALAAKLQCTIEKAVLAAA